MNELRALFPIQITRGALLRSDGVAVGLVGGGAPPWDLMAATARAQTGGDYHRLLLALDAPLDIYLVDQAPEVTGALAALREGQVQAAHPLQAEILGELADYLTTLAQQSGSRTKQVIWAVTVNRNAAPRATPRLELRRRLRRSTHSAATAPPGGLTALTRAAEQARRLADALSPLGGTPAARLLEAEEIARLLYALADPVRAQRYPLVGSLLDRVRRIVTPDGLTPGGAPGAAHAVAFEERHL